MGHLLRASENGDTGECDNSRNKNAEECDNSKNRRAGECDDCDTLDNKNPGEFNYLFYE